MTGRPLVRAVDVDVRRGRREILRSVDLRIWSGDVVAVLGPNGAGKSTLLHVVAGLLEPSRGTVERHGRVAAALQSPDLSRGSVRANVEQALAWWGVPRRERPARASAALTAVHADHLSRRSARGLSGGERRRVHLARALALRPDVLLLDEPFAGLDHATRAAILRDAALALRANARAVMVVVHDRSEAWALADRIVVILDGRIAADGPPRDILEAPPSAEVARFLGFDGEVRVPGGVLLTRPSHVVIDPDGILEATVVAVVPLEDGARIELDTPTGRVSTIAQFPYPRLGDRLRVRIIGGMRFAGSDTAGAPTS